MRLYVASAPGHGLEIVFAPRPNLAAARYSAFRRLQRHAVVTVRLGLTGPERRYQIGRHPRSVRPRGVVR